MKLYLHSTVPIILKICLGGRVGRTPSTPRTPGGTPSRAASTPGRSRTGSAQGRSGTPGTPGTSRTPSSGGRTPATPSTPSNRSIRFFAESGKLKWKMNEKGMVEMVEGKGFLPLFLVQTFQFFGWTPDLCSNFLQ